MVRQKCAKMCIWHAPAMVTMHEVSKHRFYLPKFVAHGVLHGASPKSENLVFKGSG